jgi:ribonuclease HI
MARPQITIYTDGAARGNPGPGGYGIVMLSENSARRCLMDTNIPQTTGWNYWL